MNRQLINDWEKEGAGGRVGQGRGKGEGQKMNALTKKNTSLRQFPDLWTWVLWLILGTLVSGLKSKDFEASCVILKTWLCSKKLIISIKIVMYF